MRDCLTLLLFVFVFLLISCENGPIVRSTIDTNAQWTKDLQTINDYIDENGFSNVDTTDNGVRYTVLDPGNGASVSPNDIVSYHYTAKLTTDTVITSTIDSVLIRIGSLNSTGTIDPIRYTYTTDGWNIPKIISSAYEGGYRAGVSKVLGIIKVGGHAVLMIPSLLAYQSFDNSVYGIPRNSVLIFDIYLVNSQ